VGGALVFGAMSDGASDVAELVITFYKMYKQYALILALSAR
jgi:hypothetical protein